VVIEINANPYRLDLDWRWIDYALNKGAMLSINPDAHDLDGFADMYFGTLVARKGGLTKEHCLNAMNVDEITAYFGSK
jgi:DNA polymerase (family 10)